ncbi:hypothetical protein ACQY0O_007380 [Thecaphora frezii]
MISEQQKPLQSSHASVERRQVVRFSLVYSEQSRRPPFLKHDAQASRRLRAKPNGSATGSYVTRPCVKATSSDSGLACSVSSRLGLEPNGGGGHGLLLRDDYAVASRLCPLILNFTSA